jgi:LuxR family maltose regulon positive regulatory protein
MELCRQGGLDGTFLGRVLMSRLRQAKGDLPGALEELQSAKQAFQRADDFIIATRQIQIRLAQGDIDGAARWATPLMQMLSDPAAVQVPLLLLEVVEAIIVRVYLAQGETRKALELLDTLQATAEPAKRFGRLIEVYLLRALVHQNLDPGRNSAEAIKCFEHALGLAEPEGYTLLFLEEGPALIPLLNAVVDHQAAPSRIKKYARKLLDAFGEPDIPAAPHPRVEGASLVETLTPREMEVLELIAAGDSNQAIADRLVITVRTVKKHTGNIYQKLNASSRIQAVARAREFGLLPKD